MFLSSLGKEPGITWYDVLGVLPGATAEQVKNAFRILMSDPSVRAVFITMARSV